MGTRIRIIYIVFFSIFLLGSVVALSSLSDIKIEKRGDIFEIWKKTATYTKDQVGLRSEEITNEVKEIQSEEGYWEKNFYPTCVKDCPTMCKEMELKDNLEICIDQCPFECENQKNLMVEYNNQRIEELNNEKELFSTSIK